MHNAAARTHPTYAVRAARSTTARGSARSPIGSITSACALATPRPDRCRLARPAQLDLCALSARRTGLTALARRGRHAGSASKAKANYCVAVRVVGAQDMCMWRAWLKRTGTGRNSWTSARHASSGLLARSRWQQLQHERAILSRGALSMRQQ